MTKTATKVTKKMIEESPSDFTQKLRDAFWSKFDYDIQRVYGELKKMQEKRGDRLIDPRHLKRKY